MLHLHHLLNSIPVRELLEHFESKNYDEALALCQRLVTDPPPLSVLELACATGVAVALCQVSRDAQQPKDDLSERLCGFLQAQPKKHVLRLALDLFEKGDIGEFAVLALSRACGEDKDLIKRLEAIVEFGFIRKEALS